MSDNEEDLTDSKPSLSEQWRLFGYQQAEKAKKKKPAQTQSGFHAPGDALPGSAGFNGSALPGAAGFGSSGGSDGNKRFSLKDQYLMAMGYNSQALSKVQQTIDDNVIAEILKNRWKTVKIGNGAIGWGVNRIMQEAVKNRLMTLKTPGPESDAALRRLGIPKAGLDAARQLLQEVVFAQSAGQFKTIKNGTPPQNKPWWRII